MAQLGSASYTATKHAVEAFAEQVAFEHAHLVAGASRGIGEAVAHGMAEHGATVICTSRKVADCQKVADAIKAKGGQASAMTLHLGELDDHDTVLAEIEKEAVQL